MIAAGAPGVELLSENIRRECKQLKVAIDLNAVPPAGIGGIQAARQSRRPGRPDLLRRDRRRRHEDETPQGGDPPLFESNDVVLDAEEIYALGEQI